MTHRYPASGTLYELLRRTGGLRLSTVRDWTEHLLRSMGRLHQRNMTIQGTGHGRTRAFLACWADVITACGVARGGAGITSDTIVFASDERPLFATAGYMGILLGTLPRMPCRPASTAVSPTLLLRAAGFPTTCSHEAERRLGRRRSAAALVRAAPASVGTGASCETDELSRSTHRCQAFARPPPEEVDWTSTMAKYGAGARTRGGFYVLDRVADETVPVLTSLASIGNWICGTSAASCWR